MHTFFKKRYICFFRFSDTWRTAGGVFLLSRMVIIFCTYFAWSNLKINVRGPQSSPHACLLNPQSCLYAWRFLDTRHFIDIAQRGYANSSNTAFFPFYPLLIRFVAFSLGGSPDSYYYASLIISNLCFFFVLCIFYALVSLDFDRSTARGSILFLTFSPFSFFFFAGYSESLFLLLVVCALFLLRRQRPRDWWLVGLCGFGALLTRSDGIVLPAVVVVVFLQRWWPLWQARFRRVSSSMEANMQLLSFLRALVVLIGTCTLMLLGLLTYMGYLWLTKGNPLLFSVAEMHTWGRHLSWPWIGLLRTLRYLLFTTRLRDYRNLVDLLFTLALLLIVLLSCTRLPLVYTVFSLGTALFALLYPWPEHPLTAVTRFFLPMISVYVMLALWSKHPNVGRVCEVLCITLFVINTIAFVTWNWAA